MSHTTELTFPTNWPDWAQEVVSEKRGRTAVIALEEHANRYPEHRLAWHGSHFQLEVLIPQPPVGIDAEGYFYSDIDPAVCLSDPNQRFAFEGAILRSLINRRALPELVRADRYWSGWFVGRNGQFWPITTTEAVTERQKVPSSGYMYGCLVSDLGRVTRDSRRQAEIRVLNEVTPCFATKTRADDLPPFLVLVDVFGHEKQPLEHVRQVFRAAQKDMRQARLDYKLTTFCKLWPVPAELL